MSTSVERRIIDTGFRIAKVFRNKEGHVAVLWHKYEPQDYRDVEKALAAFYQSVFHETLKLKFSLGQDEKVEFQISSIG